jgi:hypothetical protein
MTFVRAGVRFGWQGATRFLAVAFRARDAALIRRLR